MPDPSGPFVFPRRWKVIDTKQNDLLTRDEVLDLLSISRSALYQLMESHGFPRPIKVLEQSNRWIRAEIDAWLGERPRANIKVRELATSDSPSG